MNTRKSRKLRQQDGALLNTPAVKLRPNRIGGILIGLVCVFFLTQNGVVAQQEPNKTLKIPDGTIIRVALTEPLSSGTNHQNDQVHFAVAEDVTIGTVVVIAKGASAIGHVSEAEPKGKWGHAGKLAFSVDYAKAVDGSNIRLRASSAQGGQDSKGALMLGLSGAFKHGKEITIAKGTALDAYVDGDRSVTLP